MKTSAGLTPNRPAVNKAGKKRKTKKAAKAGISRPAGVPPELHREIMRRINNRHYENGDICSLRHGGPGLAELAGLISLMRDLDRAAVLFYAQELAKVVPVLKGCMRCEAKLFAILHILLQASDKDRAMLYRILVLEREEWLRSSGYDRDFLAEVQEASRAKSPRMKLGDREGNDG